MQKSAPYHKEPIQAFADASHALSHVGSIKRTNIHLFQVTGRMYYGLQSVKIQIQITAQEGHSLVTVKADGDDIFEVGAKKSIDRFFEALVNVDNPNASLQKSRAIHLKVSLAAITGVAILAAIFLSSKGDVKKIFSDSSELIVSKQPPETQIEPTQVQTTPNANAAERARCIQQAKTQGYRNGQCAYTFIETCIRTQSRKEMEGVLRADAILGYGTRLVCSNMPSDFVNEFDKF